MVKLEAAEGEGAAWLLGVLCGMAEAVQLRCLFRSIAICRGARPQACASEPSALQNYRFI
jgi:hypothetical protein